MIEKKKEEKERKKGAPPIVLAGARHGARLATGGLGAGMSGSGVVALLALGTKTSTVLLLVCLGISAWQMGEYLRPSDTGKDPRLALGAAASSSKPQYEIDASKLPSDHRFGSSMQVVPESIDGKTAEQRAAEAAAAEKKAKEEAERQAKADAAAKAPEASAKSAGNEGSPAAGAAEAVKKGLFSSKPLGLGSSGRSGLNGGAGLFGGSRGFSQKLGESKGLGTAVAPGRTAAAAVPRSAGRGRGAFKQLTRAANLSQAGANVAAGETSVQTADQAFNNNPGANSLITGAGAGSHPGTAAPADTGGTTNPTSGSTNQTQQTSGGGAPEPGHVNASPWKIWQMIGGICLLIAIVLLAIIPLVKKAYPAMAKMLAVAAMAMGAIAALCGFAIMGMGQKAFGIMMIVGGGLVAVLAALAMRGDEEASNEEVTNVNTGTTNVQTTVGLDAPKLGSNVGSFGEAAGKFAPGPTTGIG